MTDLLKTAKSIVVHFAHICAYGVETVKCHESTLSHLSLFLPVFSHFYFFSPLFVLIEHVLGYSIDKRV